MSKDIIRKFLSDATAHPDTTEVRIGDQVVTLGTLRALDSEERQDLSKRIDAAKKAETELRKQQSDAVELGKKAQEAYDAAMEAQRKSTTPTITPGTDPWETDVWLKPVKKALDEKDAKIDQLTSTIKSLVAVVGNAANTFSEDRWDRQYGGIDFGKRDKKPTREELLTYAKENKIHDRHGLPSIDGAWAKMTEGERLEELRKSEREKGREEGRMEAVANRLPPPGVPGAGPTVTPKIPANGDLLGDLYAESLKDPELAALVSQLPV